MQNVVGASSAPRRPLLRKGLLWRENVDGWVMVLPWVLGFLFFTLGPMVASAVLGLMKWDVLTPARWVGLQNFQALARDPIFTLSLFNTAFYTFLGVPLYLVASLCSAFLLNQKLKGIPIYRTIFFVPSLTPSVANALLWIWIYSPDFGLANAALRLAGLPPQKWIFDAQMAKPSFIIMGLWAIGGQMIIFLAGLQAISRELHEAASIDGANDARRFVHITLPMLSPTIFFNLVIGIIESFQIFTTAYIATNGGPQNATLFYVLYLYRNAFQYLKMGYASALAWVLFVIVLALTLVQFRLASRLVYYEGEVRG